MLCKKVTVGWRMEIGLWTLKPFFLFRAPSEAYGGSQARDQIRAAAASLHHSHSHSGSEPHLRPTPQLMATPDPSPTERDHGLNLRPHGCSSDLFFFFLKKKIDLFSRAVLGSQQN